MYGLNIIAGAVVQLSPELRLALQGATTGTVEKIIAKPAGGVHKIFKHVAVVNLHNKAVADRRKINVSCLKLMENI